MSYIKDGRCATCGTPIRTCGKRNTTHCFPCAMATRQKCDPTLTFATWSERSAYLLGFMCADGYLLDSDGRKRVGFALADKQLFDVVYAAMGCTNVPRLQASGAWRVQFGSPRLFDELVAAGCPPRKSLTITMPAVPDAWLGAFVRGYFDGDGGITVRYEARQRTSRYLHAHITFTSGSRVFLEGLRDRIGLAGQVLRGHGAWSLVYAGRAGIEGVYVLMYNNCSAGLYGPVKRARCDAYRSEFSSRARYTARRLGQVLSP